MYLPDLERVRDIKSIEILIDLLRTRVGSTTSYTVPANDLQVSIHTVKHWLQILENLYIIFPVRGGSWKKRMVDETVVYNSKFQIG